MDTGYSLYNSGSAIGHGLYAFNGADSANSLMYMVGVVHMMLDQLAAIAVMVTVLALFGYLVRYTFTDAGSTQSQKTIRGATRAAIALFFMVNVWTFIDVIDRVSHITPSVSVFIYFALMMVFLFWSLFALGDTVVALVTAVMRKVVDIVVLAIYDSLEGTAYGKKLKKADQLMVRLCVIFGFIALGSLATALV